MPEANPFQDPLRFERRVPPCAIVIFGANGDLTKRKLIPALYRLAYDRRLPPGFAIIGNSRTGMTDEAFREKMKEALHEFLEDTPFDERLWGDFCAESVLFRRRFARSGHIHEARGRLEEVQQFAPHGGQRSVLSFHAAKPLRGGDQGYRLRQASAGPRLAAHRGGEAVRSRSRDGACAEREAQEVFDEQKSIASTTIWAKRPFRTYWLSDSATASSSRSGIAATSVRCRSRLPSRSASKAAAGITRKPALLRDMIQNHLLQVMSTVAMEPPAVFEPDVVRDERAKVLRSIRIMKPEEAAIYSVAGQYGPARIGNDEVPGFRQEARGRSECADRHILGGHVLHRQLALGRRPDLHSKREACCPSGSPISRSSSTPRRTRRFDGNADRSLVDVAEHADPPYSAGRRNLAALSFQASRRRDEAAQRVDGLQLWRKFRRRARHRHMKRCWLTLMLGDATLYTRQDMVEASWAAVQPILDYRERHPSDFPNYPAGTWGPKAADEMLARNGHTWRTP